MTLTIDRALRPCMVRQGNGKPPTRALFHCWAVRAWTHGASALVGGFSAGQEIETYAIVENEDGSVTTEQPRNIGFLDTSAVMRQYAWEDGHER